MAVQYAEVSDYRDYKDVRNTTKNDTDAAIARDLKSASTRIDAFCQRNFLSIQGTSIAYKIRSGTTKRFIGDWSSVTEVEIDGSVSDDYTLEKEPRMAHNPDFPYNYIEVPLGTKEVKLTGHRGWAEIPAGIHTCCMELAAIFRLQSSRAFRDTSSESSRPLTVSEVANELIDIYLTDYYLNRATAEVYT